MTPLDLDTLVLHAGSHHPGTEMCVMEAVSVLAGEPWSDMPACVCPVAGGFAHKLNDFLGDTERQQLKRFIPRLVGSRVDEATTRARMFLVVDRAIRVHVPRALDAVGCHDDATRLRALAPVVDQASARRAGTAYATYAAYALYGNPAAYTAYAAYAAFANPAAANTAAAAAYAAVYAAATYAAAAYVAAATARAHNNDAPATAQLAYTAALSHPIAEAIETLDLLLALEHAP